MTDTDLVDTLRWVGLIIAIGFLCLSILLGGILRELRRP